MRPIAEPPLAQLPVRAPGRDRGDVAKEFEAVMLKSMVEALRRTTSLDGEESGGQLVDHLIEDALATHLAAAGGVGLAEIFATAADEPHQIPATEMQLRLESWVRDLPDPAGSNITALNQDILAAPSGDQEKFDDLP